MPIDLPSPRREPKPPFELTGKHVLAMMVAFFSVVFVVNMVMATSALRTMPGLDARNGYDPSQAWNRGLAAERALAAEALQADLSVVRAGDGATIVFDFRDRHGTPLSGWTVEAVLAHPATRALDQTVVLKESAPGRYAGSLPAIGAGQWRVELRAVLAERSFLSRHRIMLAAAP